MIKVLIEGMTENKGGKETYILNVCKHLDKLRYDITFVSYNNKIAYEEIIKEKWFPNYICPTSPFWFVKPQTCAGQIIPVPSIRCIMGP